MEPKRGDYFQILRSLKNGGRRRKFLLFLGSNIGNFTANSRSHFSSSLRDVMNPDDLLFIGFDLQKDPHVIVRAYDDSQGVSVRFNINLLRRMNNELGANFDLDKVDALCCLPTCRVCCESFLSAVKSANRSNRNSQLANLSSNNGKPSLLRYHRNTTFE